MPTYVPTFCAIALATGLTLSIETDAFACTSAPMLSPPKNIANVDLCAGSLPANALLLTREPNVAATNTSTNPQFASIYEDAANLISFREGDTVQLSCGSMILAARDDIPPTAGATVAGGYGATHCGHAAGELVITPEIVTDEVPYVALYLGAESAPATMTSLVANTGVIMLSGHGCGAAALVDRAGNIGPKSQSSCSPHEDASPTPVGADSIGADSSGGCSTRTPSSNSVGLCGPLLFGVILFARRRAGLSLAPPFGYRS